MRRNGLLALTYIFGMGFHHAVMADEQEVKNDDFKKNVLEVIKENPKAIYDAVIAYQSKAEKDEKIASWKQYLTHPLVIDISSNPVKGKIDAKITLVEFSDYLCPYCLKMESALKALLEEHGNELRVVIVNLPLHPQSLEAAEAAWAAEQQGKYFEYHDLLFKKAGHIQKNTYVQLAKQLNFDLKKFNHDRNSYRARQSVEADSKKAQNLGINGTPSFILNGLLLQGVMPIEELEEAISVVADQTQEEAR